MGVLRRGMMAIMMLLSGCVGPQTTASQPEPEHKPMPTGSLYTACEKPRPEICTQDYAPVCARRDTGIRCVKAPCPASELKTYSNGCSACGDPKVYGFYPGSCKKPLQQK